MTGGRSDNPLPRDPTEVPPEELRRLRARLREAVGFAKNGHPSLGLRILSGERDHLRTASAQEPWHPELLLYWEHALQAYERFTSVSRFLDEGQELPRRDPAQG